MRKLTQKKLFFRFDFDKIDWQTKCEPNKCFLQLNKYALSENDRMTGIR